MSEASMLLSRMVSGAVKQSLPGLEMNEQELDALVQLCSMSASPTGKEDPRALLRLLSDPMIDTVVSSHKKMAANPILGRLCQFFTIEWCWRHKHLEEDWNWQWDNSTGGKLNFRATKPLHEIPELAGQI